MTDPELKQLLEDIAFEIAYDVHVTSAGDISGCYDAAEDIMILLHRRGILRGGP